MPNKEDFIEKAGRVTKKIVTDAKNTWKKNNERVRQGPDNPTKKILTAVDKVVNKFKKGYNKEYKRGGRVMGESCFRNQKD